MAFSVFISYSTRDLQTADVIRQWVQHARASAFVAEHTLPPGSPLAQEILRAIQTCDLFLLLWSTNARASEWVPQEIGVAKGLQKPIIPVVLQDALELPAFIRDLKYLPLHRNPKAAVEWLHRYLVERVVQKELQTVAAAAVLTAIVAALLAGSTTGGKGAT
jgi:hypothetical protein